MDKLGVPTYWVAGVGSFPVWRKIILCKSNQKGNLEAPWMDFSFQDLLLILSKWACSVSCIRPTMVVALDRSWVLAWHGRRERIIYMQASLRYIYKDWDLRLDWRSKDQEQFQLPYFNERGKNVADPPVNQEGTIFSPLWEGCVLMIHSQSALSKFVGGFLLLLLK